MFGFKKKSKKELLQKKYAKLMEEAYKLSHSDRQASDLKTAQAQEILELIEAMDQS